MATAGDLNGDVNTVTAFSTNHILATPVSVPNAGIAVGFLAKASGIIGGNDNVQGALYADNGSNAPGALIAISSDVWHPAINGIGTFTFPGATMPTAGTYWVALIFDADTGPFSGMFNLTQYVGGTILKYSQSYAAGFPALLSGGSSVSSYSFAATIIFTPTDLPANSYLGEITGGVNRSSIGGSAFNSNQVWVLQITPPVDGTITGVTYYIAQTLGVPFVSKFVLYDDHVVAGNHEPNNLLATSPEATSFTVNKNQTNFSAPISVTGGQIYYVGCFTPDLMPTFDGALDTAFITSQTYASGAPNPFGTVLAAGFGAPTFYANFTPTSPPPPPPPPPPAGCSTYSGTSNAVRLIPFQFNTQQAYCLEFGDHYMRVIRNGGLVLEPAYAITGASNSNPASLNAPGNDFVSGDWVFVENIIGATGYNDNFYIVGTAGGSFTLTDLDGTPINSTSYGTYISGGTVARVFVLTTPWAASDLALLKFTQSNDVMTLTHTLYQPYDLTRTQHYAWTLTKITFAATVQEPSLGGELAQNPVPDTTALYYRYQVTAVIDSTGEESVGSIPSGQIGNSPLDQNKGCQNLIGIIPPTSGPQPSRYNVYKATPVGPVSDTLPGSNEPAGPQDIFGYIGTTVTTKFIDANILADFTQTPPLHRNPFGNGQITDIKVLTPGGHYSIGSDVVPADVPVMTDPTGTGWIGYANYFNDLTTPGQVVSISTIDPGHDYTAPVLTLPSATGSGATFSVSFGPQTGNYPGCVTYSQQRKVFAGSLNDPDTLWMTQTGNFTNMDVSIPVRDSDAVTATLASNQVNAIQFLVEVPTGLAVFTDSNPWLVTGGAAGAAVTPSSVTAQPQAVSGCSHTLPPIKINYELLYVEFFNAVVRDLTYNFYFNIYTGTDITVLSSHLFFGHQLIEWTWADYPSKLIWAVRDDGILLSCTFMKEQEVTGWAHHDTNGCFQSICSIPEGDEQAVYMAVERRIPGVNGGNPVIYIERFASRNFLTDGIADPTKPWCVDSGLQYSGTPVQTVTGLQHLEGAEVVGLADGFTVGPLTVTGGEVTLPQEASLITLGLSYTCQLQTLRLDTGNPTIQDKRKQISRCTVRIADTRGLEVGTTFDTLTPYKERTPSMPFNTPIPLITDDEGMPIDPDWNAGGQICVQQANPLPATITGILPWTQLGDSPG